MTKRLDVMFNARFPEGLCAFVREEAKRQGVSASEYVRRAVAQAMPDNPPADAQRQGVSATDYVRRAVALAMPDSFHADDDSDAEREPARHSRSQAH